MGVLDLSVAGFAAAPEPWLLLLAAMLIEAVWPPRLRPAFLTGGVSRGFGSLTGVIERRLNGPARSQVKRLFRGAVVVAMVVAVAVGLGVGLQRAATSVPFGWVAVFLVLLSAVSLRSALADARAIDAAMRVSHAQAQRVAAQILGPATAGMDEAALARALAEHLAEGVSVGMVGPVFWFSLLGMPGLLALGAVHAAARAMPEQSARFEEFGMAAARLNAALFVLPGLLAGALIALAASFTPDAQVVRAFAAMGSARNRYRTRRTDWPAAA